MKAGGGVTLNEGGGVGGDWLVVAMSCEDAAGVEICGSTRIGTGSSLVIAVALGVVCSSSSSTSSTAAGISTSWLWVVAKSLFLGSWASRALSSARRVSSSSWRVGVGKRVSVKGACRFSSFSSSPSCIIISGGGGRWTLSGALLSLNLAVSASVSG